MKATNHQLYVSQSGYGHWTIETCHYGKLISTTTTDSMSIDDFKSDNTRRSNAAMKNLRKQIIWANKGGRNA